MTDRDRAQPALPSPASSATSSPTRRCRAPGSRPAFWAGFRGIVHDLAPKNRALLAQRDDAAGPDRRSGIATTARRSICDAYKAFLQRDRLSRCRKARPSRSTTENVDPEIATIAGPQLVVPVMNARYALNAANARWGSLYDALYGTDAIPEADGAEKGSGYNPERGAKVIAWARDFLDEAVPLDGASWHADATALSRSTDGRLAVDARRRGSTGLQTPAQFAGYRGEPRGPPGGPAAQQRPAYRGR